MERGLISDHWKLEREASGLMRGEKRKEKRPYEDQGCVSFPRDIKGLIMVTTKTFFHLRLSLSVV